MTYHGDWGLIQQRLASSPHTLVIRTMQTNIGNHIVCRGGLQAGSWCNRLCPSDGDRGLNAVFRLHSAASCSKILHMLNVYRQSMCRSVVGTAFRLGPSLERAPTRVDYPIGLGAGKGVVERDFEAQAYWRARRKLLWHCRGLRSLVCLVHGQIRVRLRDLRAIDAKWHLPAVPDTAGEVCDLMHASWVDVDGE